MADSMQEVEVKFLEVDGGSLTRKLLAIGAKKIFEGEVFAVYFEHPLGLIGSSEQLRLRRKRDVVKGDIVELTYKKDKEKGKAKIADETEVKVSDYDAMHSLLRHLGFQEKRSQQKYRVSYQVKNFLYEFDTMPNIPTFLEVEANSIKSLEEAVSLIGLSMENAKSWSGRDVIDYYARRK